MKYTTTFKKAVLRKVLPPENRSVHSVSMGVGEMTIHRWIAQVKDGTINFEQDEENPSGQRNMTEKLNLLLEYQKIPQDQNGEWLRQNAESVTYTKTPWGMMYFNSERIHQGLDYKTPDEVYESGLITNRLKSKPMAA